MLVVLVRDGADNDADPRKNTSAHDETRAKLGEGSLCGVEHQLTGHRREKVREKREKRNIYLARSKVQKSQ